MVALQTRFGLLRPRIVSERIDRHIFTGNQNVVADDLERGPVAALAVPHPDFIHFQHRGFNSGVNVGAWLGHPIHKTATGVGVRRTGSLEWVEAASDNVHSRSGGFFHAASRAAHIGFCAVEEVTLVWATFHKIAELRRVNQHAMRERFHVRVKPRVVFMQNTKIFGLNQFALELTVYGARFNNPDTFAKTDANSLGN